MTGSTAGEFEGVSAEPSVVVAGDWHGNRFWLGRAIPAAARTGARTILHVGDFGIWPGETDRLLTTVGYWCEQSRGENGGIERIVVVPGNHEDYSLLDACFEANPGQAVQLSDHVWVVPRGFRFEIGGRTFLAFGGAASIDRWNRYPGRSWWPSELPTWDEVSLAVEGGHADVLVTHDVGTHLTPEVARIVHDPSPVWSHREVEYANSARPFIANVVDGTTPMVHLHGHFHVRGSGSFTRQDLPQLRVESLHRDGYNGNLVMLDIATLDVREIEL